eukprot:CAMPEP_0194026618 /NCGR_PEP_ID=MMETSP0009_2-20130614/924_1 /TAXON_ID=210454 /ORGANISM="Grammatophora oceanica, Strain CCMP 410" /LENGTH=365 /DNA_ID=CAMNT_0038665415 /DNA_START=78 /DNA_END=1175 /DNA_ORIENTATION=-
MVSSKLFVVGVLSFFCMLPNSIAFPTKEEQSYHLRSARQISNDSQSLQKKKNPSPAADTDVPTRNDRSLLTVYIRLEHIRSYLIWLGLGSDTGDDHETQVADRYGMGGETTAVMGNTGESDEEEPEQEESEDEEEHESEEEELEEEEPGEEDVEEEEPEEEEPAAEASEEDEPAGDVEEEEPEEEEPASEASEEDEPAEEESPGEEAKGKEEDEEEELEKVEKDKSEELADEEQEEEEPDEEAGSEIARAEDEEEEAVVVDKEGHIDQGYLDRGDPDEKYSYVDLYPHLEFGSAYVKDATDVSVSGKNDGTKCTTTEYCLGIDFLKLYGRIYLEKPCCLAYRGGYCGSSNQDGAICVPLKTDFSD